MLRKKLIRLPLAMQSESKIVCMTQTAHGNMRVETRTFIRCGCGNEVFRKRIVNLGDFELQCEECSSTVYIRIQVEPGKVKDAS